MDDSAPKRRRTSPRTSIEIHPDPNPQNGTATTTDTPGGKTTEPTSPRKRPASFASPTKASLARSNPNILARHSAGPTNGNTAPSHPPTTTATSVSTARQEPTPAATSTEATDFSKPRRGALFPTITNPLSRRLSERPRRSAAAKDTTEEPSNPFRGRTLRRSGAGLANVVNADPPLDPELPLTRVQMGLDDLVVTSPAAGIHNSSSPSRRSLKRQQGVSGTPTKGSSLSQVRSTADDDEEPMGSQESPSRKHTTVQQAETPVETLAQQPPEERPPAKSDVSPTRMKKEAAKKHAAKSKSKSKWSAPGSRPRRDTQDIIDPARGITPRDKYWEKRELIERLKKEAEILQEDLDFAKSENDRIREQVLKQSTMGLDEGGDKEQVLQLLRTHVLPKEPKPEKTVASQMVDIAMNPMSWLPFGGEQLPTLLKVAKEREEVVKSHAPVKMSMEEELPFLQLFTPLEFSSQTFMMKQKEGEPALARQTITAVPKADPGVFACRLEMTVDTQKLAITELSVPSVDIRAQAELGPFLEEMLLNPRNKVHRNNIGIVTWAMGEWYRVASSRAIFWCTLAAELEEEDGGGVEGLARRARTAKKKGEAGEKMKKEGFPKADVIERLGQMAMEVPVRLPGEGKEMKVRIQWKIGFDWTGEAVSEAGLLVGVPGKWQKSDKRGMLPQVSKLFNELVVGGRDVLGASRTIIALLAGQSG